MLLSIFSNPNVAHLIEIFSWMLGAFLIGLFFGRFIKSKEKDSHMVNLEKYEDFNIKDDLSKIRATKTFERGGKKMAKSVLVDISKNSLNFNRIGIATIQDKNNLQEIKGIGASIEVKLNNIGIYNYKQISNFNSKDIAKITDLIKFFPGRIERDDWVGQALQKLQSLKDEKSPD